MSEKPRRKRLAKPTAATSRAGGRAAADADGTTPAPTGPRLIRKYGNRRLYDTRSSRYVTLEDLVEVFAGDEEVRVVDAVGGEDITKKVMAQAILFEEDRRHSVIIPLELLRSLLRNHDQAAGDVYQRRLAKTLADLTRLRGRPVPAAVAAPVDDKSEELDELRRRLKALEKQIQRR